MALTGAEGLVTALKTYIEASIGAKLTALDTEYGDGITLATTVATYVGLKSLQEIPEYPALFIIATEQEDLNWSTKGGESRPGITLGIDVIDADSEILQRRLYRYGRALREMLLDAVDAGSLASWNPVTDEPWRSDYVSAAMSESLDTPFVGEVTLSIRANKVETM